MTEALHVAYRPRDWSEVVGQSAAVASLKKQIEKGQTQSFLLCGPSGTGKTTLARIAAEKLGCPEQNVLEIDAATYTGVDDMRKIHDLLRFKPFGADKTRVIILDEAHRLSRNAWDSLLKAIEEPPDGVYWFLCTTEVGKVPDTIKTRCIAFTLKEVRDKDLERLVTEVAEVEKLKLADGVLGVILKQAHGSPRQALVNLAQAAHCKDRKHASETLFAAMESDTVLELCRFVARAQGSWQRVMGFMEKLSEENPEGLRILIVNYLAAALRGSKNDAEACHFLRVLELFSTPFNPSEGMAPLYLAIGKTLFDAQATDD